MDVKMKRGSVNMLSNMLQQPGWYKGNVGLVYAGGSILIETLKDLDGIDPPEKAGSDREILKNWLGEVIEFVLNDNQVKAVVACILFSVEKSQLPINSYTYELLTTFGVEGVSL